MTLWSQVQERAIRDREDYLDAWRGTGNEAVIRDIEAEIARTKALKGLQLARAIAVDREGVRLAFLAAQCWFESLADAGVGAEKTAATVMANRVTEKRIKLFGRTRLEVEMARAVSVPTHQVGKMVQSGLAPSEFLGTLNRQ